MQVRVWDTCKEHACGCVCSPGGRPPGFICHIFFLEACRPGPPFLTGDSRQAGRPSRWVRGWGRSGEGGAGQGCFLLKVEQAGAGLGAHRALSRRRGCALQPGPLQPPPPALPLPPPEPLQSTLPAAARAMLPNCKSDRVTPHSPSFPSQAERRSQTLPLARVWPALQGGWEGRVRCSSASASPPRPCPLECGWPLGYFLSSFPPPSFRASLLSLLEQGSVAQPLLIPGISAQRGLAWLCDLKKLRFCKLLY